VRRRGRTQDPRCSALGGAARPYRRGRVGLQGDNAAVAEHGLLAVGLDWSSIKGRVGASPSTGARTGWRAPSGHHGRVGLRGVRPGESQRTLVARHRAARRRLCSAAGALLCGEDEAVLRGAVVLRGGGV
jgi:hypothetical protein